MKRLLYLAALAIVASLVLAPAALAQVRGPSGGDGTYNCDSFDTQEQAQAFYDADPSDPNSLDTDGDGIPCEVAPSGVAEDATLLGGYPDGPAEMNDLDCVDFGTQADAQATYNADTSDPNGLDRDGDGIACESSFSVASGTTFEDGSGMIEGTGGGQVAGAGGDTGVAADQYEPRSLVVSDDGQVTIDGDVGTDCRSFAISVEDGYTLGLTPQQIQSVLDRCDELGLLSSGDAAQPEESGPAPQSEPTIAAGDELPDTGGISPIALGSVVLLIAGGLIVRRFVS